MAKKNKVPDFMLVIRSDDVDETLIKVIRKQLKKALKKKKHGNVPIFTVGREDCVELIKF